MADFKTLKDAINKIAEGSESPEVLKSLGVALQQVDEVEKDFKTVVDNNVALRKDYVEAVKNASFKPDKQDDPIEEHRPTLEELMLKQAQLERSKKN